MFGKWIHYQEKKRMDKTQTFEDPFLLSALLFLGPFETLNDNPVRQDLQRYPVAGQYEVGLLSHW